MDEEKEYIYLTIKTPKELMAKLKKTVQILNADQPARKYTQTSVVIEAIEAYTDRQIRKAAKKAAQKKPEK